MKCPNCKQEIDAVSVMPHAKSCNNCGAEFYGEGEYCQLHQVPEDKEHVDDAFDRHNEEVEHRREDANEFFSFIKK